MELLAVVTINQYVRKVQTAKQAQATYYKYGEKVPTKYNIGVNSQWVKFTDGTVLCDAKKLPIIKNKNAAGKPRYMIFNGQDLHKLTLKDYERSKIIKAIKAQMIPEVNKLEPITKYPIRIMCEIHDTTYDMEYLDSKGKPKDIRWDIDNRTIYYCKCFPDILSGCLEADKDTGELVATSKIIIIDDDRLHITQPPTPLFFPISNHNERKLIFKIYHDDREVVLSNKDYGRN